MEYVESGALRVHLDCWKEESVRLTLLDRIESWNKTICVLFIDWNEEAYKLCWLVCAEKMPPFAFADWIDEHRQLWRAPSAYRNCVGELICDVLRGRVTELTEEKRTELERLLKEKV